jgi:Xaa-Pro dipeptidase
VIDFGGRYRDYFSDTTRTLFLGQPDEELRIVYQTVALAKEAATRAIVPGKRMGDLDRIARDIITTAGYGPYFTHRLGHSLGLEVHEEPYLHGANDQPLVVGMCFSVEPGIYLPGRFGVRIEDCVVLTEEGLLSLISFPRELTVR